MENEVHLKNYTNHQQTASQSLVELLFDFRRPAIRTDIAGYSHAVYEQHTRVSHKIYSQIFQIFNEFGLDYYLFAGTVVGYVRNERPPPWMDDIDIIVFEDQIDYFEKIIIPHLKSCGFTCFIPGRFNGGGWQIRAMEQGMVRDLTIPLTDDLGVSVPWAQIDVFYTTVDQTGCIRNPAHWGLYDRKHIPVSWVKPGLQVELDGWQVKIFSEYKKDIEKEYGDVTNNVKVWTHSKLFLTIENTPWNAFDDEFKRIIAQSAREFPPSVDNESLKRFSPKEESIFTSSHGQSFDSIMCSILRQQAHQLSIFDEDHIFWVVDIKRLLPRLRICVHLVSRRSAKRAAHLQDCIDRVTAETQELDDIYTGYMQSLALKKP
jgi:hypothetical protein